MDYYIFSYVAEGIVKRRNESNHRFIRNPLKVLRNFGHVIKNLGIYLYSTNEKLCIEIENYLTKYCSDTLERLLLVGNQSIVPFEHLPKPLKNVTVVKVILLRGQHINHIRFINERNLPNVNNIEIFWQTKEFKQQELLKFHFESIEYFTFSILKPLSMNLFSFGNLKHLRLELTPSNVDDSVCELIGSIKDLKTVQVGLFPLSVEPDSLAKLLKLQNILSTVVELTIHYTGCTTKDVLHFLKQSRKLQKLSFRIWRDRYETKWMDFMETISTSLPHNWSSRIEEINREENEFTLQDDCFYILEKNADE